MSDLDNLDAIADNFAQPIFHENMTGAERQRRRAAWSRKVTRRRPAKVSLAYLSFLAASEVRT